MMKQGLLLSLFLATLNPVFGQVLISLLLGDKLNSGKVEFGLDGGANFSSMAGVPGSAPATGFHLGFYFDIKTKHQWLFHTGVIVKSPLGAHGLPVYPLGNPDLDQAFQGGIVSRNLRCFNVPVMIKYPFRNHFYAEGGIILGLLYKAFDKFENDINTSNDLSYTVNIKDQFHPLDVGLTAGLGYRLLRGNGMNLGIRYYYGVVDIVVDDNSPNVFNRSLYLAVGIPIGAGKARQRAEAGN